MQRGWRMFPTIDRVYVNDRARHDLDWYPRHNVDTAAAAVVFTAVLSGIGALVGGLGHQVPDRRDDLGAEDDRTR